jgi:hypothetical protein
MSKKKRVILLNSKSQVTLFIIIALLIVFILVMLFVNKAKIINFFGEETSPIEQIQKCIKDSAQDGIKTLSSQGGSLSPKNYYLYEGNKVEYLCYTMEYYKPCVMQKPLLRQSIENELKAYLEPKINECLENIKTSLENSGYNVLFKKPKVSIELLPKNVVINSATDLAIEKEKTESYNNIKTIVPYNLYDFSMIASSIANFETRYGDIETLSYMLYYPNLKLEKKTQSEGTRVYILTWRDSQQKFMFATRSVAFAAGLTGN